MKDYFSNTQTKEPDKPPNIQHHNNLQTKQNTKGIIAAINQTGKIKLLSSATPRIVITTIQGTRTNQIISLPDSGATISAASTLLATKHKFKINPVNNNEYDIRDANNKQIQITGTTTLTLMLDNKQTTTQILISPSLPHQEMIIGWKEMMKLGIIAQHFPNPCQPGAQCCNKDTLLQIYNQNNKPQQKEETKQIQQTTITNKQTQNNNKQTRTYPPTRKYENIPIKS